MLEFFTSCEKRMLHSKKVQTSPDMPSLMWAIYTLLFLPSQASNAPPSFKLRLYRENSKARKRLSRKKIVFQALWSCLRNNEQFIHFHHVTGRFWLWGKACWQQFPPHPHRQLHVTQHLLCPRHWAQLLPSVISFHLSPIQQCESHHFSSKPNIRSA